MKPPKRFKVKRDAYGLCDACRKWKHTNIFYADESLWRLCEVDYADFWENTDTLPSDYKGYSHG